MTATTTALPGLALRARRTTSPGMTDGAVRTWLRLEGLAALAAGLAIYAASGGNWLLIVPLILLPDISAAGYLAGPRAGAFAYNAFHTWVPGVLILGIGVWLGSSAVVMAAAVLIAHVGMDRVAGYGLKLPTSFQDTHLGRMGRAKG